jgi:hypothetical protein
MKHRIAKSIARAVSAKPERVDVHFHLDSDGRPFVCDIARCESPRPLVSSKSRAAPRQTQ